VEAAGVAAVLAALVEEVALAVLEVVSVAVEVLVGEELEEVGEIGPIMAGQING
jgi:hypothetical protein